MDVISEQGDKRPEGQIVFGSLPIQKAPPLALTAWRWKGDPDLEAMRVKGEVASRLLKSCWTGDAAVRDRSAVRVTVSAGLESIMGICVSDAGGLELSLKRSEALCEVVMMAKDLIPLNL